MTRERVEVLTLSAAVASLLLFTLLAVGVATGREAPAFPDGDLRNWAVDHRSPTGVSVARVLTSTGTGPVPYLLAALAGLSVGRGTRQRILTAVTCLACLALGQALRFATMSLIARPRPPVADWATHASRWAFPSGHTSTSVIAAGLVITAVLLRAPRCGKALMVAVGCWSVLVGLTRVYLGVHWFTDVLGGSLFGVLWLSVCACVVARFRLDSLSGRRAVAGED